MQVKYIYLDRQYKKLRTELLNSIDDIMSRGAFILRPEVEEFEKKISDRLGVRNIIGVNSGTDALYLGMRALCLPKSAEVITVAHTYISTIGAIHHAGLKPKVIDISHDFNINADLIEKAITKKTRAILVVHMNGRICKMSQIQKIASKYKLDLLEDAAQAFGAKYNEESPGSFGRWAAFSLHPMKVLAAAGDAGFLATNNDKLASDIRMLRNIGQRTKGVFETYGFNSRIDTIQAAICLVKLKYFDESLIRRKRIAERYNYELSSCNRYVLPPKEDDGCCDIYSAYALQAEKRNNLQETLKNKGIETMIHWDPPLHRQTRFGFNRLNLPVTDEVSKKVISLPIDPEMTDEEQKYVIKCLKDA